ncbi:MAG: efflux RND transporter permease subunit [Caulobacteraceae bacterium]|nr:efflux RND transporter permease subunit [Caulobacteraceae bacterium]
MNLTAIFVRRPIATTLLTLGLALAGAFAFFLLPVAPLPAVDFPTVFVQASLPGASPETMATSVAAPLERHLGHIADVSEMTSQSRVGQSTVILQFGLDRNVDGAARDVQAAIVASRADLPSTLRSNPTYRKANPSAQPILILALHSDTRKPTQIYDSAANLIQQKLSQVKGVGEVNIGGGSLPAVRAELNPFALAHYGIGMEDVRAALASANANRPKGVVQEGEHRLQIYTNDAGIVAADYAPLVIAYRNGAAVRLSDVATVRDGQEDIHNLGLFNGRPSIVVFITKQPGANVIETADAIKAELPALQASLPADIDMTITNDNTVSVRASLHEVEMTLLIATLQVVEVVALFLGAGGATLIPGVAVVVSLLGTLGVIYLLGFSLNALSLMALTVCTGFVVDDAIVVLENITRHTEQGMKRFDAAILGAKEVGFTVLSISASLIAVFLPILMMGGMVGRLFREFAVTLSVSILISLVVSLTTTPMMCAYLAGRPKAGGYLGWLNRASDRAFDAMAGLYRRSLIWALDSGPVILVILAATVALNVYLFTIVPKGFFPQQSNGSLSGFMQADQSTSFQLTQQRLKRFVDIIRADPDVTQVTGFTGGRSASGQVFITLRPAPERKGQISDDEVIARLRKSMRVVSGATLFLQSNQDVRAGGRQSFAQYQYTLRADDLATLKTWAGKLTVELKKRPVLTDLNSDQEDHGLESYVTIDRDSASRLGLTAADIDNTLYDAFGQRQVSTIYNALNQYHVIMEVDPRFSQNASALESLYVSTNSAAKGASSTSASTTITSTTNALSVTSVLDSRANGVSTAAGSQTTLAGPVAPPSRNSANGVAVSSVKEGMAPLAAIASFAPASAPTSVSRQGGALATTLSFNLEPGHSIGEAQAIIEAAQVSIHMPATVQGSFQGTAKQFQDTVGNEPLLILTAILAIYIVLGVLYESYIHPLTVLSTLPSAGVGASIALILFHTEFGLIALIGVILLIGIVKKNAIMIIDFALGAERAQGLSSRDAIFQACLLRFRPIMMTTFAAILGALPLVLNNGQGSELRKPLGITIIGGLLVSQLLTLLTTPVVYLYLDRFRRRGADERRLSRGGGAIPPDSEFDPEPAI